MTTTHQTSRVTGLLFYSGGSANLPLQPIDAVRVDAEGRLVGFHSGKTQAQLQVEIGLEIKIAGAETFEELRDAYYTTAPEQITESDFLDALNVLPPMRWGRWLGVESFRISELYSGNITTIYARTPDGQYWKFRDRAPGSLGWQGLCPEPQDQRPPDRLTRHRPRSHHVSPHHARP